MHRDLVWLLTLHFLLLVIALDLHPTRYISYLSSASIPDRSVPLPSFAFHFVSFRSKMLTDRVTLNDTGYTLPSTFSDA